MPPPPADPHEHHQNNRWAWIVSAVAITGAAWSWPSLLAFAAKTVSALPGLGRLAVLDQRRRRRTPVGPIILFALVRLARTPACLGVRQPLVAEIGPASSGLVGVNCQACLTYTVSYQFVSQH